MQETVFITSAILMFAALGLPAFLNPDNPAWKKRITRLAWIVFVIGLIGGILSCTSWPQNMPIDGGG